MAHMIPISGSPDLVNIMYPITVEKVAATLGGARVLVTEPHSLGELSDAIARGLPRDVVPALAAEAAPDRGDLRRKVAALVVSPATYKRGRRLSPAAGERAERLARVTALAHQVMGDRDEARDWLTQPHPLLGGQSPIETAATDLGARVIERILHNIAFGLPV